MAAQLLGPDVLSAAPGRTDRARAAHWALRPAPLAMSGAVPPAVQLTVLVLAAHTGPEAGRADAEHLTHLCGLSQTQLEDLFDRLIRANVLETWHCDHDAGDIHWTRHPPPWNGR